MSWTVLFERAEEYDVQTETITETLRKRRDEN